MCVSEHVKVKVTFLKMVSYPGSAHRKLSVSLPESRWAVEGQQLVLLGKLGDSEEGSERQDQPVEMKLQTMRNSLNEGVEQMCM